MEHKELKNDEDKHKIFLIKKNPKTSLQSGIKSNSTESKKPIDFNAFSCLQK